MYIDLHRHLEGSITPFVVTRRGKPLDSLWKKDKGFFEIWDPIVTYMGSIEACQEILYYALEELALLDTAYAEFMFSSSSTLDNFSLFSALRESADKARRDFGIESNLIYVLTREQPEKFESDLACASRLFERGAVAALGLAGNEGAFPLSRIGAALCSHLPPEIPMTVHAGEFTDAQEVRDALALGVKRIGHAARISGERDLMRKIYDRNVGIEACLTSNVALDNVAALDVHPFVEFCRHGLSVSINTDDPAVFGTEIDDEYALAEQLVPGCSDVCTRNAIDMSFASRDVKRKLYVLCDRAVPADVLVASGEPS